LLVGSHLKPHKIDLIPEVTAAETPVDSRMVGIGTQYRNYIAFNTNKNR